MSHTWKQGWEALSGMNSLVFWGDCQQDKLSPGGQIPCGLCKSIFWWMCWGGGERKCFTPVCSSCQRQAGGEQAGPGGKRACWDQTQRNQSAFPAATDSWAASRQGAGVGPPNPASGGEFRILAGCRKQRLRGCGRLMGALGSWGEADVRSRSSLVVRALSGGREARLSGSWSQTSASPWTEPRAVDCDVLALPMYETSDLL